MTRDEIVDVRQGGSHPGGGRVEAVLALCGFTQTTRCATAGQPRRSARPAASARRAPSRPSTITTTAPRASAALAPPVEERLERRLPSRVPPLQSGDARAAPASARSGRGRRSSRVTRVSRVPSVKTSVPRAAADGGVGEAQHRVRVRRHRAAHVEQQDQRGAAAPVPAGRAALGSPPCSQHAAHGPVRVQIGPRRGSRRSRRAGCATGQGRRAGRAAGAARRARRRSAGHVAVAQHLGVARGRGRTGIGPTFPPSPGVGAGSATVDGATRTAAGRDAQVRPGQLAAEVGGERRVVPRRGRPGPAQSVRRPAQ